MTATPTLCRTNKSPQTPRFLTLALLVSCVLVSGCQAPSERRPGASRLPSGFELPSADRDTLSGDELMQQAASASGRRASALYLSAAEAYTQAADWSGLRAALESIADVTTDAPLYLQYARLQAGLSLQDGDAAAASQWLANRQPALDALRGRDPNADATSVIEAAVCAAQERYVCATNALIRVTEPGVFQSAPWFASSGTPDIQHNTPGNTPANQSVNARLAEPSTAPLNRIGDQSLSTSAVPRFADPQKAAAASLNNQLWHYLTHAPASQVAEQAAAASSRNAQGWWNLYSTVSKSKSLSEQQQAMGLWQRRYASHSAAFPWPSALAAVLATPQRITQLAVVLPLSGPLSAAGTAVRNGLVSAALADEQPLQLRFYDAAAEPLPALYERAIANGAEAIIGPLSKANVDTLTAVTPQVPTLALNYLAEGAQAPTNLLQFGLAIEDEADTLVRALTEQERQRVLILHSEQDWSRRAAARLAERFAGAITVESFADAKTVTEALGRGMLIEESQRRSQGVYRQIGSHIEFTPRARDDLDAIVALVNNTEAKVLVPALKFHFGDHLPVYVTGQATRGAASEDLGSLTGFQVTEIPWFVSGSTLAQEVTKAFRLSGNSLAALYALGSDAYQVADRLPLAASHTDLVFAGSSGALHLRGDGTFRRELSLGVISNSRVIAMPRVSVRQ